MLPLGNILLFHGSSAWTNDSVSRFFCIKEELPLCILKRMIGYSGTIYYPVMFHLHFKHYFLNRGKQMPLESFRLLASNS
jgi:hypothetical protein